MYGRKFESDFTPLFDIFCCFEPKNKGLQALIRDIFESYQQFSEKFSTGVLITRVNNFSAHKPNGDGVFGDNNHPWRGANWSAPTGVGADWSAFRV